jgi:hypothetical protein
LSPRQIAMPIRRISLSDKRACFFSIAPSLHASRCSTDRVASVLADSAENNSRRKYHAKWLPATRRLPAFSVMHSGKCQHRAPSDSQDTLWMPTAAAPTVPRKGTAEDKGLAESACYTSC